MNYNNIDGQWGDALRDVMLGEPPDDMDDDKLDGMLAALAREFGYDEEENIVDVNHPDEGWFYNDKY